MAKVAVDQVVTIYDGHHDEQQWEPWDKFIDEQGRWYTTEFVRNRQYKLHEQASPLLIYRIIPSCGMKWIGNDQTIFSRWLACILGDMESAASIGEIVSIGDGKSVYKILISGATILQRFVIRPSRGVTLCNGVWGFGRK